MKILVGYDGAKHSGELIDTAVKHANAFKANVHILISTPYSPEVTPEKIEQTEKDLDRIKRRFKTEDLHCEIKVLSGSMTPAEDLVAYAIDHDIDEIIIGVKKRSKIGKFIMGSTAQYIIMEAPCNVLIAKTAKR
ncbi:MAG: universal stress protein [Desulfatitalea sp.]|nr:universal stress protein [Desulfatitalea sp.]NNK02027.1 universal stress protein [Desulfatitalea sp.]